MQVDKIVWPWRWVKIENKKVKLTLKIIGTILTVLIIAFYFIIGISIASSSHNITTLDREGAISESKIALAIGLIVIMTIWLPWKRILKRNWHFLTLNLLEQENNNSPLSIFPNPFSTQSTLRTAERLQNASLTIYNSVGQTVKCIDNLSGQTVLFQRDNSPSGLYFVRLTQDGNTISADKFVITDK